MDKAEFDRIVAEGNEINGMKQTAREYRSLNKTIENLNRIGKYQKMSGAYDFD